MIALARIPNVLFFLLAPDSPGARAYESDMQSADNEEGSGRRDFILERMTQNSDAFAGSYDVEAMQALYPDRF